MLSLMLAYCPVPAHILDDDAAAVVLTVAVVTATVVPKVFQKENVQIFLLSNVFAQFNFKKKEKMFHFFT